MNPHLTLAYESLKQCQVIQFIFNTMKSFNKRIQNKSQGLWQWDRVVWQHHGLTIEIRNRALDWAITLTVAFDSTIYSSLDCYLDFILPVC